MAKIKPLSSRIADLFSCVGDKKHRFRPIPGEPDILQCMNCEMTIVKDVHIPPSVRKVLKKRSRGQA